MAHEQDEDTRRDYLLRGRGITARLKDENRLAPTEDWIDWFDARLAECRLSNGDRYRFWHSACSMDRGTTRNTEVVDRVPAAYIP